jgi:epoxyqueuosine reductase
VCPFNGSETTRPVTAELEARPSLDAPGLVPLLDLRSNAYRQFVKRSALRRIGRDQIKRNAAVALGNTGDARAVEPLTKTLAWERNGMVRAHAAWALGRLGGEDAKIALEFASRHDAEESVRAEARLALESLESTSA